MCVEWINGLRIEEDKSPFPTRSISLTQSFLLVKQDVHLMSSFQLSSYTFSRCLPHCSPKYCFNANQAAPGPWSPQGELWVPLALVWGKLPYCKTWGAPQREGKGKGDTLRM